MAAGDAAEGAACGGRGQHNAAVEIVPEPERRPPRRRVERAGFIEIEFGCGARVCIRGEVAPRTLRQVIELLR